MTTKNGEVHATGVKLSIAVMISIASGVVGAAGGAVSVAVAYGKAMERMEAQDKRVEANLERIALVEGVAIINARDIAVLESQVSGVKDKLDDIQNYQEKLDEKMDRVLERLPSLPLPR